MTAAPAASPAAELGPVGLRWQPGGRVVLSGPLLGLAAACDAAFAELGTVWNAEPEDHPAMIDAAGLQAIDYLTSFPHLATFPVCLDPDEQNLAAFTAGGPVDGDGAVRFANTAPVREVLTPAACYHVYLHHRGERLDAARYLMIANTCFRREAYYEPLRRQWSFRMREIVCLGSRDEVTAFLARTRELVGALLSALDLPVRWEVATDPFFQPARNAKYLAQRLQPTKHEAVFGGDLAIASVNLHEDHFGRAFEISRAAPTGPAGPDGPTAAAGPAVSGCVAFGLERWLYALTRRHGPDPAGWPDVAAAARAVAGSAAGR